MSRKTISIIVGVAVVVLLAAIAIPNFVPARFTSSVGKPIHFKIRVIAQEGGAPIPCAEVQMNLKRAVADADGYCDIEHYFPAHGIVGRSGVCSLGGTLRVAAQDFSVWEKELASLFGKSYDYFNKGTQITYVVSLAE
jgi:hypothetical protein